MAIVLTDMQLAESYSIYSPRDTIAKTSKNNDTLLKYTQIALQKNKITEADFNKAVQWYVHHPDLFDSVYQQVLSTLSKLQTKLPVKQNQTEPLKPQLALPNY